jgi:hypothetical protein
VIAKSLAIEILARNSELIAPGISAACHGRLPLPEMSEQGPCDHFLEEDVFIPMRDQRPAELLWL